MANSRIYFKSEAGGTTVVSRDTSATSGNLVLPASGNVASVDTAVTDNAIARFDSTTGKLQNSSVTIDDGGNIGTGTQTFNGFGGSGFKNYIINGNFNVWQRKGKTPAAYIDEHTADRWKCKTVKDGVSHYTFLCSYVSNIANMPHNYMALVLQDTNANRIVFEQRLEQSSLANKNVGDDMTISFFLGHNGTSFFNPSATMQLNIYSPTTVDNWTSSILEKSFIIGTIATMPAYGTKYAITFQLTQNMISFGLNFSFNLFVTVGTAVGSVNSTFRVAQVQLEEGSVATPFENRPIGLELSLCQRYFQKFRIKGRAAGGYCSFGRTLQTTMRTVPTLSNRYFYINETTSITDYSVYSTDTEITLNWTVTGAGIPFIDVSHDLSAEL